MEEIGQLDRDRSGKVWFGVFRLHGPLAPSFDKILRLGEIEWVN
jgi:hypothetical protein